MKIEQIEVDKMYLGTDHAIRKVVGMDEFGVVEFRLPIFGASLSLATESWPALADSEPSKMTVEQFAQLAEREW